MKVNAYAKLNLYLDITRVREDGYHELDMIMQEVDLADILTFLPAEELDVECEGVPREKNLAYRAAQAFFAAAQIPPQMHISIEKHIPSEAGMGGGSSDAACVLRTLNEQFGKPLSMERLTELALPLGADVPFALLGGTARAQGIGEKLTPITNRLQAHYLIVKPPRGVPTGKAFQLADSLPREAFSGDILACKEALEKDDPQHFAKNTYNALTRPGILLCPEIDTVLNALRGQDGCFAAFMTGSGSACVGMFRGYDHAETALREMQKTFPEAFCALTRNVTR